MERVLEERSRKLILPPDDAAAAEPQAAAPGEASANTQAPLPGPTQSELRRQRRLARYEEVVALFQSGHSQAAISKALGLQRKTIRRWLRGGVFPERKPPHRPPPKVNEFGAYLEQRWNEGCHNATVLAQEIRDKGDRGKRSMVARFVASWRKKRPPGGIGRRGDFVEHRPSLGPNQPPQDDQAPDVRAGRLRTAAGAGVAVLVSERRGSLTLNRIKIAEEPSSEYRNHLGPDALMRQAPFELAAGGEPNTMGGSAL